MTREANDPAPLTAVPEVHVGPGPAQTAPAVPDLTGGVGNQAFAQFAATVARAAGQPPPAPVAVPKPGDRAVQQALARAVLARRGGAVRDPPAASGSAAESVEEDADVALPAAAPPGQSPSPDAPPAGVGASPVAALDPEATAPDGAVAPPAPGAAPALGGAPDRGGAPAFDGIAAPSALAPAPGGAPAPGAAGPAGMAGGAGRGEPGPGAAAAGGPGPARPAPARERAAPAAPAARTPAAPGPPPAVDAPTAGSVADLLTRIAEQREHVATRVDEAHAQLDQAADAELVNAESAGQSEAARIAGQVGAAIETVQKAALDAERNVETTREAQTARVEEAATGRLKELDGAIAAKQKEVRAVAAQKAQVASAAGDREAERGLAGCRLKAADALQIGTTKAAELEPTKRGGRKARAAREMAKDTSEAIVKAGQEMAETARGDAKKLADKIRKEGEEVAGKLASGDLDAARERIGKRRAAALEAIGTAASQTTAGIRKDRDALLAELRIQQASAAAVLDVAAASGRIVDEHRGQAHAALDAMSAQMVEGLDTAAVSASGLMGVPGDQLSAMAGELDGVGADFDGDVDALTSTTRTAMETASADAAGAMGRQGNMLVEPAQSGATTFAAQATASADKCVSGMVAEGDDATADMTAVTDKVGQELDRAVAEATREWDKALKEGLPAIAKKVDDGLAKQQETLSALPGKIDEKAREIHEESWWSRAFSFVGGIFGGFFSGLWNMVKFLGVLVIAVVVLIVVAVVIGAIIGGLAGVLAVLGAVAAIAGFIASIGTVLLVAGAILVAGIVALRVYRLATDDSLTDYERGHLVGESIFDIGSLVFGAKLAKWVGGLATAGEGGVDAAQLAKLRGLVADDVLLEQLLGIVGREGAALETMLGRVANDAGKLRRLLVLCGDDATRLEGLLQKLGTGADRAEDLLRAAGGDVAQLESALAKAGGNADEAQRLLGRPPGAEPPTGAPGEAPPADVRAPGPAPQPTEVVPPRRGCFPAGTPVLTPAGSRPIETLAVGDEVLALDPERGAASVAAVTATHARAGASVLALTAAGTTIHVTAEHPFWVPGAGWRDAGTLEPGTPLLCRSGGATVASIERLARPATVHNLTVGGMHTYFVSEAGVLVHNKAWEAERPPTVAELPKARTDSMAAARDGEAAARRAAARARAAGDRKAAAEADRLADDLASIHDGMKGSSTPEEFQGVEEWRRTAMDDLEDVLQRYPEPAPAPAREAAPEAEPVAEPEAPPDRVIDKDDFPKDPGPFKEPIPHSGGKEGATDVPDWVKGQRPHVGESGKAFAERMLRTRFPDRTTFDRGPKTDWDQIRKYGDRHFQDPVE